MGQEPRSVDKGGSTEGAGAGPGAGARRGPEGLSTGGKLCAYLLVPGGLSLALLGAYFYGPGWLREIVAPSYNREFGLLENLQNLFLLAICWTAARTLARAPRSLEGAVMALVLAGAVFLLLEEIDYGVHYYEYLQGLPVGAHRGFRNVHNVGNNSSLIKTASHGVLLLWFAVFPLALGRSRHPLVRYFVPPLWLLGTLGCVQAAGALGRALSNLQAGAHPLSHSMSEFTELITYYLGLLYVLVLSHRRLGGGPAEGPPPSRPLPRP